MINLKSEREILLMRQSCQLAAQTLAHVERQLEIGMTTADVDHICHEFMVQHNAYPATLGYHGYTKSSCTSINEVICHGIPSKKVTLKDGDILNIDVTPKLNGFHGDTNKTFLIGNVSEPVLKLVEVTYQCLMESIKEVKPGARLGNIGAKIQEVAEGHGYSVVRDFCGHGIGREFHEDPQVLHYGKRGSGVELLPGMTFTIEPMINLGRRESKILKDGWTAITIDKKPSAQFEHTVLVTEDGVEILTVLPEGESFMTPFVP